MNTIKSTSPPPPAAGPYTGFYGDGRAADFVLADIRLRSLKFTGNVALQQDAVTPVPSPEFTWDPATGNSSSSNPAAYVQGKSVGFTLAFCDSTGVALTGSATTGYTMKVQAAPNTTDPATSQPDPTLTLYDNTVASPVVPTTFSGSTATVTASTALSGWVSKYGMSFSPINVYVQFSHVTPTPTWGLVSSSTSSGSALYAVVATPAAPMASPWVSVLDYACDWAKRSADATTATASLTSNFYYSGHYNGGTGGDVDTLSDTGENFHLGTFLSSSPALSGQCNDFSDFLVCASNALGALSLQSQRSTTYAHISDGSAGFQTNAITDAPQGPPNIGSPTSFVFHQWTNSGAVYDAAIRFGGLTAAVNLNGPAPGTTYYNDLVNTSQSNYYWLPVTFLPTAVN